MLAVLQPLVRPWTLVRLGDGDARCLTLRDRGRRQRSGRYLMNEQGPRGWQRMVAGGRIAPPARRDYRNTMPTITFKVTAREAARIREMARREGVTVSEFLRRRAIQPPPGAPEGEYRITQDPVTGLPVMEAPRSVQPVSSEQVRALLADFP